MIPWFLDSLIPWILASLIPWLLDSMIPWFLDALIPWFFDSLMPWFLDSFIPWFLAPLIPWFLWNLCPQMPPFAIVGIFFREVGGCWLGPGVRNDECQSVPDLTQKSLFFRTPQKAVPRGPGIAFSQMFIEFGKLFEVIWWLFFSKNTDMEKVCLDCAGVYGLHIRPSRKLHFF